jgi:probable phosphoglycerate mutase
MGEVRYGKWQGKKLKKLSKKPAWHIIQHYPSRFRFPDGESLFEVQQRAVSAIEELAQDHQGELFAIVSHADVIKLALAHYLGMHIDLFQRLGISPASASLVALPDSGIVRVLRVNDHGPIELPSAPDEHKKTSRNAHHLEASGERKPLEDQHSQDSSLTTGATSISETEETTK